MRKLTYISIGAIYIISTVLEFGLSTTWFFPGNMP